MNAGRTFSFLFLSLACVAQAPAKLHVDVDATNPPELPVVASWQAVPGATSYIVYEAKNPGLTDLSCPAKPAVADSTVFTTYYDDNPNPGWWQLPTSDTDGRWKGRVWCYWVSAVVSDKEGPAAGPKSVTVGNGGYVFLGFVGPGTYSLIDKCLAGPRLPAPSTNLADWTIELYYQAPGSTVHHDFQLQTLFEGQTLAAIWHVPSIATDGSVIPWGDAGGYDYKITYKPWGKSVVGSWSPRVSRAWNYYTQLNANMLIDPGQPDNGAQCTLNYFGQYDLLENVITP